jgi:hypothetical protein
MGSATTGLPTTSLIAAQGCSVTANEVSWAI